tara:strand:+ start:17257 stop:17853 length:597 start_codon:yes stop_codon:yes gene_type:complete
MYGNYGMLCRYFEDLDSIKTPLKNLYYPSSLAQIGPSIEQLVQRGVIDSSKPFLDAGSGDARVVALTGGVHELDSVGADYYDGFCDEAERNIRILKVLGILNEVPIRIVRGDFTSDETYKNGGIRFEDFGTVYNFQTNEGDIAEKIARQSPSGTVFLLLTWQRNPKDFDGLGLEESIQLPQQGLHVYRRSNRKNFYIP